MGKIVHLPPFIIATPLGTDILYFFLVIFRRFFSQNGHVFCIGCHQRPNRSKMSKPLKADEDVADYYGLEWVEGMWVCRDYVDEYRAWKVCHILLALDGCEIYLANYSPSRCGVFKMGGDLQHFPAQSPFFVSGDVFDFYSDFAIFFPQKRNKVANELPTADPPPALRSNGDVIMDNACLLLEWMCPTSPLCRNLVKWLSEGMSTRQAATALGVSHTMVWRARHDSVDWLVMMTVHPGMHQDRVDQEDVDFFLQVLDDVAPYASGRPYREQTVTNRRLYEIYMEQCNEEGQQPLSLLFIQTRGMYYYSYQHIILM